MTQAELETTRAMMEIVHKKFKPANFLTKNFFNEMPPQRAKVFDLVIKKGTRKIAPYSAELLKGKIVDSTKKEITSLKPPLQKFKFVLTNEELETSSGVFYINGAIDELEQKIQEEIDDKIDMAERRLTQQAYEIITSGKLEIKEKGVNLKIDFGFESSQIKTLTGTDLWSDSNSNPYQDLKDWKKEITDRGGIVDSVIMGAEASDAFINNAKIKELFDTRRIDLGEIKPEILDDYTTKEAHLRSLGLNVYTVTGNYENENGAIVEFLDPKKIIMLSSNPKMKGKIVFTSITAEGGQTFAVKMHVRTWQDKELDTINFEFKSKPLVVPTQIEQYVTAKVV